MRGKVCIICVFVNDGKLSRSVLVLIVIPLKFCYGMSYGNTVPLLILLAIALPLSLLAGRVWIDPGSTPNAALILADLRLPRSLLAIAVGAGLGASGAAMTGRALKYRTMSGMILFMT